MRKRKISFSWRGVFAGLGLLITASFAVAWADDSSDHLSQTIPLGAKSLMIIRDCDDCELSASIDGQIIDKDAIIQPRRRYSDAHVDAIIMMFHNGGNGGCITRYAIVWATKSGNVGFTRPFYDQCYEDPDFIITQGEIIVRFAPNIGRDGEVYHWTLKDGLTGPIQEPFAPDLGQDWSSLSDEDDPWDTFKNADLYAAFKSALGSDFELFRTCLAGRGSALQRVEGGFLVAETMADHFEERQYDRRQAVFAINPEWKQVFVAIQALSRQWRFYPAGTVWPEGLKKRISDLDPLMRLPTE